MIMAYRSDNGLVQDIKITEFVCYSVAMSYVSYDVIVEDGKYAKMYEFGPICIHKQPWKICLSVGTVINLVSSCRM